MPETHIIKSMPKNPYLLAYFKAKGLDIGDKWIAADYITWIDGKHDEFRGIHHLPSHIELNGEEQQRFITFLN